MNAKKIINQFQKLYPEKRIFPNDLKIPTEIICEVEPSSSHPDFSIAVAVIDNSFPHFHKKSKELYEVIKGELKINKDGQDYFLKEGESLEIVPGEIHFAQGNSVWIKVTSHPGWTVEDHLLIKNKKVCKKQK